MITWAWLFLVLAILAAIFGFGGLVAAAADVFIVLFFLFLAIFVIGLIAGGRTV